MGKNLSEATHVRFNSSVVRLEVSRYIPYSPIRQVSIPVWCDWKLTERKLPSFLSLFQFQCGAIGSIR